MQIRKYKIKLLTALRMQSFALMLGNFLIKCKINASFSMIIIRIKKAAIQRMAGIMGSPVADRRDSQVLETG